MLVESSDGNGIEVRSGFGNGIEVESFYGNAIEADGDVLILGAVKIYASDFSVYGSANGDLYWNGFNSQLGIGTATPSRRLEVRESGAPQLRLSESASAYWDMWAGSNLHFDNGSGTYPLTLSYAGNLGVGPPA